MEPDFGFSSQILFSVCFAVSLNYFSEFPRGTPILNDRGKFLLRATFAKFLEESFIAPILVGYPINTTMGLTLPDD